MELGVKIGFSLGIVSGPGAVFLGATGGLIGGIIGGLFSRILSSQLELNSDCLYYKYIPKKYRFINPNLRWKNVSNKAKSFAIEMIDENYEYKWLVLNIPCSVREIHSNNNIGDTIIQYKGISDNSLRIFFNLYELKNEKPLTLKDWKNTQYLTSNIITQVASLEVN